MDNTKDDYFFLEKNKTDTEFIVAHMKEVDVQGLNDTFGFTYPD